MRGAMVGATNNRRAAASDGVREPDQGPIMIAIIPTIFMTKRNNEILHQRRRITTASRAAKETARRESHHRDVVQNALVHTRAAKQGPKHRNTSLPAAAHIGMAASLNEEASAIASRINVSTISIIVMASKGVIIRIEL